MASAWNCRWIGRECLLIRSTWFCLLDKFIVMEVHLSVLLFWVGEMDVCLYFVCMVKASFKDLKKSSNQRYHLLIVLMMMNASNSFVAASYVQTASINRFRTCKIVSSIVTFFNIKWYKKQCFKYTTVQMSMIKGLGIKGQKSCSIYSNR